MSRREFQLIEGTSSKFWTISLDDAVQTVHYGRIGTAGQTSRKEFDTEIEAKLSHDKLVAEKIKKGYVEVVDGEATAGATPAPTPPAPARRSKPVPKSKPEPDPEPTTSSDAAKDAVPEPEPALSAEPEQESSPQPAPTLSVERSIDLAPADWFWDAHRLGTPLTRPESAPFKLEAGFKSLAKVATTAHAPAWDWSKIALSPGMSREEASFWLFVMTTIPWNKPPKQTLADLRASYSADGRVEPFAAMAKKLEAQGRVAPPEVMIPLALFYSLDDLWQFMNRIVGQRDYNSFDGNHDLLAGFRRYVLPYLSQDEVRSLQERAREALDPSAFPSGFHETFPASWYLAAALGLYDEVAALVRAIPDDQYQDASASWKDYYHRPQLLVLGLGDPKRVEAEWRRLHLLHKRPEDVRGWLAVTGWSALGPVRDSILALSNKDECSVLLELLAKVRAPEAAPVMLELMLGSKAPKVARQWLEDNPGHAIAGLIPVAAGRGKLADTAMEFLRAQKQKGQAEFIRDCLTTATPEVAAKIRAEVLDRAEVIITRLDETTTPEPIRTAVQDAAKLKVPGWVDISSLPPVLVGEHALNEHQTQAFLAALAKSTLAAPHALVAAVKAHADRLSLDALAWALFEQWRAEGTPSKEKWAMLGLGLIGSDASAMKLTPLVRAWPGESQHQRAVTGLECLRAIGTDVAMMQLNGIAQKLSFKGLKAKAAEMMEAIAADRNLTRAQLEDRIVPDCELDDRGSRVFDFGPRQFRFVLGTEMKPMVRDSDGKLKTDLPKPGTKDDTALATAAVNAWKLLKKQVREVAKVQADRLEQAMVIGRRWTVADFETLLVKHPLMTNLVRLILWGGYDESGKLVSTFRVTEERDYADVNEATLSLQGVAKVGIVHPLHLSEADQAAWGEIFGDYEIIPPFPQLGRPVHRLEPEEQNAKEIVRNKGLKVPAITLVGILDRHGWIRGMPEDAGVFHEHSKAFEGANVTAIVQYDGIPIGAMIDWDDQDMKSCFFIPGVYKPGVYPDHKKQLTLGSVDPVVISEVLGTLGAVAAKAQ